MKCSNLKLDSILQQWKTPFLKQCFVTSGVTLNLSGIGFMMGFSVALLDQLKDPNSDIVINDEEGSWIASIPGLLTFPGAVFAIPIMGKYGPRTLNLISIILLIVGWVPIIFAPNVAVIYVGRILQGINMGMTTTFGSILIGEYTSPRYRGMFIMTISLSSALSIVSSHVIGAYLPWRIGAFVITIVTVANLVIVFFSPESPSWLAIQGRYEESKTAFRWLRGNSEEDELNKLMKTCILKRNLNERTDASKSVITKAKTKIANFNAAISKKEFYKPMIIIAHLNVLISMNGLILLVSYPTDYIRHISGNDVNVSLVIISLDLQRFIVCILSTYMFKNTRRRVMLSVTVSINVIALLSNTLYLYAKNHYELPCDHPIIGILLTHSIMFSIALGSSSLPYIVAGEILPLGQKNLGGAISTFIFSIYNFMLCKTLPFLYTNAGVDGTMGIYTAIVFYTLVVSWFILPETQGMTLQEIEEEFRGKPLSDTNVSSTTIGI